MVKFTDVLRLILQHGKCQNKCISNYTLQLISLLLQTARKKPLLISQGVELRYLFSNCDFLKPQWTFM
jgi:hypothetical protein